MRIDVGNLTIGSGRPHNPNYNFDLSNYEINSLPFYHHFGLDKGVRTVITSTSLSASSERSEGSLLFDYKRFFAGAQNDKNQIHSYLQ